ncbi:MAG: hypothetical protein D6675_08450 [Gemmatimonadetes bacterium]|nr:MAG: hypothetical protein D6675_08450 [Gemmatimonadota bacterium]
MKLNVVSVLLLVCLSSFSAAPSAVIHQINLSGNTVFTTQNILNDFSFQTGTPFDSSQVNPNLQTLLIRYRDEGYHHARIIWNWIDSTGTVSLHIDEGPQVTVGEVDWYGNFSIRTDRLLPLMDTRPGTIFRESLFLQDVDRVLHRYAEHGFPYAKVQPVDFRYSSEGSILNFRMHIDEGRRVTLGSIQIVGNTITNSEVIRRILRLREGDLYNQERIDAAERRLRQSGFFAEVAPFQLLQPDDPTRVTLLVRVVEDRTSRVSGVIGYIPENNTHAGYWTSQLDLSFPNLAGTGRHVDVDWQRKDPYSSFIHFYYREPWIGGSPLSAGIDLQQTIQDSLYTKRQAQLRLHVPVTADISGELHFASEEVIPGAQAQNPIDQSDKTFTGGALTWDTRNSRYNPDHGSFFRISAHYGKRRYEEKEDAAEGVVTARWEHYFPLFPRQALAIALNGALISSTEDVIPVHEQFSLGGTHSLRGYKEDQFRGDVIGWSNVEYRFLVARESRFFLFLDRGFYQFDRWVSEDETETVRAWKIGYGVGLRVASRLGVIGIDYGLGEGDGFTAGKIHFGLAETF